MENQISDKELIKKMKKDPSQGISNALDMYGGAVKVICSSILEGFSREDIEEAVSDTFVALWKGIDHFQTIYEVSLKSYLYGIARRTALNKKRQLMKSVKTEEYNAEQEANFNTEEAAIQALNGIIVRALIKEMKSPDREIFVSRYFEEKKVKDIAIELQVSEKFVENHLARGKKKLKNKLIANGIIL